MKRLITRASIALTLGVALIVTLLWLLGGSTTPATTAPARRPHQSPGDVITVCLSGGCDHTSIQAAVDAANDGDVIKVATGTYTGVTAREGVTQVVYINKSVTIRGGYTTACTEPPDPEANPTTLDAQQQGRVLYITGDISPTVEGLRITGGDATGLDGWSAPPFDLDAGGGIYIVGTAATISNNQIFGNTAVGGGGVFLFRGDHVTLNGNTVTDNTADSGGGLFLWMFSDATLNGNTVFSNTAVWEGGGLRLDWDSRATLNGNTVSSNTANTGGGLYLGGSDATLINNVIVDNRVEDAGSGLYVGDSSPLLCHNTIARNHGGGEEGLYVTGTRPDQTRLYNTILVGHGVGIHVEGNSSAYLEGTLWANTIDWSGNVTTTHDVWGDPDFVDYVARDYHINAGSAAVDAGVYTFLDHDVDGDPRPTAFGPDIGADERPGPGLQLHTSAWQNACNPGRTVTYTLVVTGVGTGSVSDVILTDTLPPEQRVIASAASVGDCTTATTPVWGGGITCALGTLDVGDSAHITLTAQVTTTLPATLAWRMRNRVWVTGDQASNFAYADVYLQDCHVRLNDGPSEWEDIQTAVDASTLPADVVKVAGVCAGINTRGGARQVVYLDKTVTIRGGYSYSPANWTTSDPAANPTTLDAQGRGRVLYITGNINPTVEGLRITGGDADGLGGPYHSLFRVDAGGGIYIISAAAIVSNNWVFSNTACDGGGLYLQWSGATLNGNTVTTNTANGSGGGLSLLDSAATLSGNTIAANITYGYGGGLRLDFSDATLINNIVADNRADAVGSGLYIEGSSPHLLHNTIAFNIGGDGSGLKVEYGYRHPYAYYSSVALTNTILVSHTVGIAVSGSNTTTLEATLWYDNGADWGGEGTINHTDDHDGDPAFVAPDAGDYHIGPGSAAIDEGVCAGVTTDIDGHPRPSGLGCDIGADELLNIYLPIVLKNHRTWDVYCENNDQCPDACGPLVSGQTYWAYPNDTEDYYYFELTTTATVNVSVADFAPTSTWGDLLLYGPATGDGCGELIGQWGKPGYSSMSLGPYSLEAGKYHVRVYTADNYSTTQLYSLIVTY